MRAAAAAQPAPTAPRRDAVHWLGCRLDGLSARQLQYVYMARQQVFSVEQNCVYLDADGADETAFHLSAWSAAQREPLAYARVVDAGVKYAEPSIGRVLTTAAARGSGLGREVVRRAIAQSQADFPGRGIRISAQSRLEAFYAAFGFVVTGGRYLEDGILHTEMLLAAP